jgi:hypothetical protein
LIPFAMKMNYVRFLERNIKEKGKGKPKGSKARS